MGGEDYQLIAGLAGKSQLLDLVGIFFAVYLGYILVALFILIVYFRKDWRQRLYLSLLSLLSFLTSYGLIRLSLNYFFFRERPFVVYETQPLIDVAATASFPSGHATLFFTLATLMLFWIDKRWGILFMISAALIALSRVFVGVHYPLDIIGGAIIGFVTPFLIRLILPKTLSAGPKEEDIQS